MGLPNDAYYTDLLASAVSRPNTSKNVPLEKLGGDYTSEEALEDMEKLLSRPRPWPAGYASGGLMRIIKKRGGVSNVHRLAAEATTGERCLETLVQLCTQPS